MALVSVILPTFNRGALLPRALDSVAKQTFTDWELIVVDDGSSDNSEAVFANWRREFSGPQRIVWLRQENRGVSSARNFGARAASGTWLAFLDSDDEWLPHKLERQLPLMPHFRWIHGEEIWIRNGVRVNPMKKHKKSGGRIFKRCVDLCCVSPSAVVLERELYFSFGGFREDFPVCEDYDLWLKIAALNDIGFVESPLVVKYGGHADQLSRSVPAMDRYRCVALGTHLNNPRLTEDEREHLLYTLGEKSRILVNGFIKRQNREPQRPFGGGPTAPLGVERNFIR